MPTTLSGREYHDPSRARLLALQDAASIHTYLDDADREQQRQIAALREHNEQREERTLRRAEEQCHRDEEREQRAQREIQALSMAKVAAAARGDFESATPPKESAQLVPPTHP